MSCLEWLESIRKSINYIEHHLLEENVSEMIAREVYMSPFYLQKGFKLITGYSISEYMRNRRLYLSALDIIASKSKIIDIAYNYGYNTPESFTKAFYRFHGFTPLQIKTDPMKLKVFLPLKISISIQGGNDMNYVVEKVENFKVIGFQREFEFESSHQEIPKFWGEIFSQYIKTLHAKEKPENEIEEAICNYNIGDYGVSIDDIGRGGKFRYIIAGEYTDGNVPLGMSVYEFPDMEWAKFSCNGPIPGAIQSVNAKIFSEWLPGNLEYEIAMGANIEWYSKEGDTKDLEYESQIWIPVKRK